MRAWRVSREVVDGSIAPTMLERRSPQMILVSTAGDGGSKLLQEDRDAAIAQLADPETARVLLLEWSAPPEAYPDDHDAWRQASPHWTPQRMEALEHAYATSTEAEWRRQYLNQWVLASRSWIAAAQWADAGVDDLELPATPAGTLAVNDQDGRPGTCGYVLAVLDGELVRLTGRSFPRVARSGRRSTSSRAHAAVSSSSTRRRSRNTSPRSAASRRRRSARPNSAPATARRSARSSTVDSVTTATRSSPGRCSRRRRSPCPTSGRPSRRAARPGRSTSLARRSGRSAPSSDPIAGTRRSSSVARRYAPLHMDDSAGAVELDRRLIVARFP